MTSEEMRGRARAHRALADHLWEEARRLAANPAHESSLAVHSLREASTQLGYAAEGYEQLHQARDERSSSRSKGRGKGAA